MKEKRQITLLTAAVIAVGQIFAMPAFALESRNYERIINGGLAGNLTLSLMPGDKDDRWRLVGDPSLPDGTNFGGILAKVGEDGKIKIERVKPEDLGVQEYFVVFGEDPDLAGGYRIITSGYRDGKGRLRLTGTRPAPGRDNRALSRGWASVKDAAGFSKSADDTREYNLRLMTAAGRADDWNQSQKPFSLLDSRQVRAAIFQNWPIVLLIFVIWFVIWIFSRKD